MNKLVVGAALALALSGIGCRMKSAEASEPAVPVVIELFTSEGCSSCPPADKVLAALERAQPVPGAQIVPLAFHVDYWDELGWKDPFSSREWTRRQRDYGRASGTSSLYTPQLVVGGRDEMNGTESERAQKAVREAIARPRAPVTVKLQKDGSITVHVGALPKEAHAAAAADAVDVLVASVEPSARIKVEAGENSGRTLEHTAVVKSLTRAGRSGPNGGDFSLPPGSVATPRAVIIVQARDTRAIYGTAIAGL